MLGIKGTSQGTRRMRSSMTTGRGSGMTGTRTRIGGRARALGILVAATAALTGLLVPVGAQASKVGNPSDVGSPPSAPFQLTLTGGSLAITPSLAPFSLDFDALGLARPTWASHIDANGNLVLRQADINIYSGGAFPTIDQRVDSLGVSIHAQIIATQDWTGKINPVTGHVTLEVYMKIHVTADGGLVGNACDLGSVGSPVRLRLNNYASDAATTPLSINFPNLSAFPMSAYTLESGLTWPYSPDPAATAPGGGIGTSQIPRAAGSSRVGDDAIAIPSAPDCGGVGSLVNSQLGLPSTGHGFLDLGFVPGPGRTDTTSALVQKGVAARAVAKDASNALVSSSPWPQTQTPDWVTGVPLTFDGSSSTGAAGATPFQWDVDGDGTFAAPTATTTQSITYTTPGTKTVSLKASDTDTPVNVDTFARQVNVVQSTDIGVSSSVVGGAFRGGSPGVIQSLVTNNSAERANTRPITFTQTVPSGVTVSSVTASGWTCNTTTGLVTCTRPTGTLAASATSTISINVAASPTGPHDVSSTATVTQAGDVGALAANNTASFDSTITKVDLTVALSHSASELVAAGTYPYTLKVSNVGDAATGGTVSAFVNLPDGVSFVPSGSGGAGWTCVPVRDDVNNRDQVRCNRPPSSPILAGGAAPDVTLRLKVSAATAAGTITPTATVSTTAGEDTDAFGGSNTASDPSTVVVKSDLAVTASHTGNFVVGATGTYTVTLSNPTVLDAVGPTTVSYDAPAGLTIHGTPTGTGWDCSASTSTHVSCAYADSVSAGASAPAITVQVDVGHDPIATGSQTGSVTSTFTLSNDSDPVASDDSYDDVTTITRLDLAVSVSHAKGFAVGQTGQFSIAVTNVGTADTVGPVTVTVPLPSSRVTFLSGSAPWACSATPSGVVTCTLDSTVAAGASAPPLKLSMTVLDGATADPGTVAVTATLSTDRDDPAVTGDAPVTGNNVAADSAPAVSVDLAIQQTSASPFFVGEDQAQFSLKVVNVGSFPTVPGKTVTVVDELPEGFVPQTGSIAINRANWGCVAAPNATTHGTTLTCTGTPPDSGSSIVGIAQTVSIEVPLDVTDAAADVADNIATLSTEKDDNAERSPNNVSTKTLGVGRIDITTTASQSIQPRAGGIGQLTVNVANTGSHATTNPTTVTAVLPSGVTYRPSGSQTAGWICAQTDATLLCKRGDAIPAGAPAPELKLQTNVTTAAPSSWTTTVVAATLGEPATRLADNTVANIPAGLEKVDLALTKTHPAGSIQAGQTGAFTLKVKNVGNTTSSGTVEVTDTLNGYYSVLGVEGDGWTCAITGQAVRCTTTAPIGPGDTAPPLVERVKVALDAGGNRDSSPLARVQHDGDPYPANDKAADPTTILGTADLALTRMQPTATSVGGTVTVVYKVTNRGSEVADGSPVAVVTDHLGAGLTPIESSVSGAGHWDCDFATAGVATCALLGDSPLAAGQSTTLSVSYHVGAAAAPATSSIASVVANPVDPNPSNDQAPLVTYAVGTNDLSLAVTGDKETIDSDTQGTFTALVHNEGTNPTSGPVRVALPLPDGVTVHEGDNGTGWTCVVPSGTPRTLGCTQANAVAGGADAAPLSIQLTPTPANAPSVSLEFTVSTPGDENHGNDVVTIDQLVHDATPPTPVDPTTGGKLATLTDGLISIPGLGADGLAFQGGQLTLSGDIAADNTWSVKQGGVHFDPLSVPVEIPGSGIQATITASLVALADASGHLPASGDGPADLDLTVQLNVVVMVGATPLISAAQNCNLGPITFHLTGDYTASTKTIELGDDDIHLPVVSQGCGALGSTVNGLLGLPSAGNGATFHFTLGDQPTEPEEPQPTTPTITTPPPAQTTTTVIETPVDTPAAAEAMVGTVGKLSSAGKVSTAVLCAGLPTQTCSGKVAILAKSGKKTVTIGSASFSKVKGGAVKTVSVKLTSSGAKLVKKAGKKGLKTTVTATITGAKSGSTRSATLKQPAAKKPVTKKKKRR